MSIKEQLQNWFNNIPNLHNGSFRKQWIKALQKKSMRSAVNAKCQNCMCWQTAEIRECNNITCPLWQYRPNAKKDNKLTAEVVDIVTILK